LLKFILIFFQSRYPFSSKSFGDYVVKMIKILLAKKGQIHYI